MNHAERLRSVCADIRRKPYPISDVVPVMQAAADALDAMQSALDDAVAKLAARDAEVEQLRKEIEIERFRLDRSWSDGKLNDSPLPSGLVEVSEEVKGGE